MQVYILKIIFNNGMDDKKIEIYGSSVKELESIITKKDNDEEAREYFSKIRDIEEVEHNVDFDAVEGFLIFEKK